MHGQSNKYVHQAAAVHTKDHEGSDMSAHITAVLTACCNSMQPEAESSCSTQHGLPSPDPRADMGTVPSHKHTQCGPMQLHQLHAQEMYNIHTLQERYKATDVQGNICTVLQHEDDVIRRLRLLCQMQGLKGSHTIAPVAQAQCRTPSTHKHPDRITALHSASARLATVNTGQTCKQALHSEL